MRNLQGHNGFCCKKQNAPAGQSRGDLSSKKEVAVCFQSAAPPKALSSQSAVAVW